MRGCGGAAAVRGTRMRGRRIGNEAALSSAVCRTARAAALFPARARQLSMNRAPWSPRAAASGGGGPQLLNVACVLRRLRPEKTMLQKEDSAASLGRKASALPSSAAHAKGVPLPSRRRGYFLVHFLRLRLLEPAGRSLCPAEARSLRFAALRRLRPEKRVFSKLRQPFPAPLLLKFRLLEPAGRSLRPAEARSLLFAALRRLRPEQRAFRKKIAEPPQAVARRSFLLSALYNRTKKQDAP